MDNQVILVTGGTGSFGQKFTEIVLHKYRPKKLIIFSRDELKQHDMRQRFSDEEHQVMRYFIGDVRDKERLYRAFEGVDIVIHAAALKQVTACEYNPLEAIKTNIDGTKNVIDAAIDKGVKRVLFVSTDKAVNPINLYGATKLCAEKMITQANAYAGKGGTRFSTCRYGNVIGSRGSVVPLFITQRERGKITVTDPQMTRFWITLRQGVAFVIQCLDKMHGGEIFVPKIPSMSIEDLARAIAPGCTIDHIGIQPGEKLHESLISRDESRHALALEDMFIIQPMHQYWEASNWVDGQPLPNGFKYSSNLNDQWLTVEELQKMIGED